MDKYQPKSIEPKWQKIWSDTNLYKAEDDASRPKHYQLEFFPYPSGVSMHVGHVRNYVISDCFARYKRMTGHNVLHPMGWDAFGLPAENQAIKEGIAPQDSLAVNIKTFKRQLQQMGISYDWSREINSSQPDYYKWTQYLFLLFYKKGLAYKKAAPVNWCPKDKTVLANEQVIKDAGQNVCERCGTPVEKKELSQWFLRITDYADRLLEGLDDIDWPEKIKAMQRNWIGRSVGASIKFQIDGTENEVNVFTTRPDTIFGATYMVLAPEHPLIDKITSKEQRERVNSYVAAVAGKSEIERMGADREKTGVFTGAYAINPATQRPIPIWIADYVLSGYGSGAIMAVPAHDQRDYEFAQKFELPIVTVVEPVTGKPQKNPEHRKSIVAIVENDKGEVLSINWGSKFGGNLFIGGGLEEGEDPIQTAKREIAEETGYTDIELVNQTEKIHHHYFAHSKNVARQIEAVGLHFKLKSEKRDEQKLEADEAGKFTVEWLSSQQVQVQIIDELHRRVFEAVILGEVYTGEGIMVNSGSYDGLSSSVAREKAAKDFGREEINYKMRDWLISRQRYWGAPIPILYCKDCGVVPVPNEQLPVELPRLESYQPSDDGRSPLARVEDWVNTVCSKCGGKATRETDTMDTFVDSSWYFLRFADPHSSKQAFSRDKVDYWSPVDNYVGGAEHAVAHLLFARFWTKFLYDEGLVGFDEPFKALRNQGMIGGADGRKMGKRYGNVVTPDALIEQGYGADSLRLYELFIGPYDQGLDWNENGIDGTKRFLNRVWVLIQEYLLETKDERLKTKDVANELNSQFSILNSALASATHRALKKVTADIQDFGFNTAIAAQMELVNEMYKLKTDLPLNNTAWKDNLRILLLMLAPFAPHMAEELWQQMGNKESIHVMDWPAWDEKLVKSELVTIAIQVNGKLRGTMEVEAGLPNGALIKAAAEIESVARHLADKAIVKQIAVPDKLVNFVVN